MLKFVFREWEKQKETAGLDAYCGTPENELGMITDTLPLLM
jgi:hypothetical protein